VSLALSHTHRSPSGAASACSRARQRGHSSAGTHPQRLVTMLALSACCVCCA
jgi:hypothetical protein